MGIYIKEIGYSETIVGSLLSLRRVSVAFSAIVMAMLAGRFGRRNALAFGLILMGIGALGIISSKSLVIMQCMSIIFGIGQSTLMTFEAPFLYSKSTEETRVHAFSASFSARNAAFMIGSFGTGLIADFLTTYVKVDYLGIRYALYIVSAMTFVALIPLMMIEQEEHGDKLVINIRDIPTVLNKKLVTFLIYTAFIGFGAGMVVPFFGVYLRYSLSIADSTVGLILAIAQMGTVLGGLIVPLLAKKFGKVDTITIVQMGSIPFLILIGVPMNIVLVTIAFFFRSSLMNMAQPLIQNVYMEIVDEEHRPLVSSLRSTVSNLARAGGIMLGGYMMANISYGSPYAVTILCYILGTAVFRRFFRHSDSEYEICKENNIEVRVLELTDITSSLLDRFNRYQETKRVWVKEEDRCNIKDDFFVEQWNSQKKLEVTQYLRNCLGDGGIVIGAFVGKKLIGFASIESTLFGRKKEYLELTYIHVSSEYRNKGIGKKMFNQCCIKAKEKEAPKLYVGAHPAEETQLFYKSVGCTLAKEVNQEIYSREPLDIQLEYTL